jgi:hypothetical protein
MRSIPNVSSAAMKWRLGEHAAGCELDLVKDGSADRSLQVLDLESEHIIGTGQHQWQHFAHVPYDELESRMPIERAGEQLQLNPQIATGRQI